MVPVAEIASLANDYNLNIPRYIDSSEPEDLHDLDGHLNGGIPERDVDALQPYWDVFPSLRGELFQPNGRPGYLDTKVNGLQVKAAILVNPEFSVYANRVVAVFDRWQETHKDFLMRFDRGGKPKELIHTLSEDLLVRFTDLPLLNPYDVYQCQMDYWADVMHDDLDLVAADGWIEAAKPRGIIEDKDRKIKETPDLTIGRKKYKMDLVPPGLVVARFFAGEQAAIEELEALQETAARELEEFVEEHSGEEGLLEDVTNEKGKVTKTAVKDRLREIGKDPEFADEREALARCMELLEAESGAGKAVKDARGVLDKKALTRYSTLTEDDVKTLVVEDKWFASIRAGIEGEVQRLTQRLAARVKELDERYARPLPELEREVETFRAKVEEHLKRMGLSW